MTEEELGLVTWVLDDGDPSNSSLAPHSHGTGDDGENGGDTDIRNSLIRQIGKLLKEKQRILRLHKKAERKVAEILQVKEQNGEMIFKTISLKPKSKYPITADGPFSVQDEAIITKSEKKPNFRASSVGDAYEAESREDEIYDFDEKSNWGKEMLKAKQCLQEEDELAEEEEFTFRISLEETKAAADELEMEAKRRWLDFEAYVTHLFNRSLSVLMITPREFKKRKSIAHILEDIEGAAQKLEKSRRDLLKLELLSANNENGGKDPTRKRSNVRDVILLQMEHESKQEEIRLKEIGAENLVSRLRLMTERQRMISRRRNYIEKKVKSNQKELKELKNLRSQMVRDLAGQRQGLKATRIRPANWDKFLLYSDPLIFSDVYSTFQNPVN